MSQEELKLNKSDALKIPILEVGRIVVPRFVDKGKYSTGECCRHEDKKLGNLRFVESKNYAHCFTCKTGFDPIKLVTEFKNCDFQEALEFLHSYFPHYFTTNADSHVGWKGLSIREYNYLGIKSQVTLGNVSMDIRQFAKKYPLDHDTLLINKIISMKENMEDIKEQLLLKKIDARKIEKDEMKVNEKLLGFFKKGIVSKEYKRTYLKREKFLYALQEIIKDGVLSPGGLHEKI